MIEIYEKRGKWCYRDAEGNLFKFDTEQAAKSSLGLETLDNGSQKEKDNGEKKDSKAKDYFQAPHGKTTIGVGKKDTASKGKKN
jgi:hypothetical protein